MTNRIINIETHTQRLSPAEADLWVIVAAERTTAGTEIRGRFVGPKCALSSTIEVAYPLRPFERKPAELAELAARVVIPEPSLWEPECPFVYDGVIELWQDGQCCDVRQMPGYKLMRESL
jgi:hypothetical protein